MKRVGIMRGGAGEGYETSLKRGGEVILFISENLADKYKPIDILIDKDYIWHYGGVPVNPGDLIHKVDLIWNVSHPSFSNILESLSVPNIGASSFSHALENSKEILKEHMARLEVEMPRSIVSPKTAREVFEKFGAPWRVGDKLVKTFPELAEAVDNGQNILVEEFILGKVASVHSVANFRGEDIYVFPPDNVFGVFSLPEKERLINLAKGIHKHLGAEHYLKSNFIVNKRGRIYLSYVDLTPNLKEGSHFHLACESVGAKMHQVVEHILERAL